MKQIYIDMASDEDMMSSNSDDIVTIMRENNNQIQMQIKQYCTVEFKFCVLFQGAVWYLHRSLQTIKSMMNKIQRDKENSEHEQC